MSVSQHCRRKKRMSRFINPRHLLGATKNSLSGLVFAWKGEQAFRHEVLVLAVLALLLAATGKGAGEWLLVLGGWLGVMVVELLNSADEESFDLVTTEWNERVKRGKDMASAAIFLAMVINAGIETVVVLDDKDHYRIIPVSSWVEEDESLQGQLGY